MSDERRKREHGERGKRFRLTGGCFRPCSCSFPLNSSVNNDEKRSTGWRTGVNAGEWSRRVTRERRWARGIRVTRMKGTKERAAKHYAGWHSCGGARLYERKREKEGDAERANGGSSHTGRMTGLLRRGEESGGYDRRRVQIITIIIFPGNMAAERGWPPGSLVYA